MYYIYMNKNRQGALLVAEKMGRVHFQMQKNGQEAFGAGEI